VAPFHGHRSTTPRVLTFKDLARICFNLNEAIELEGNYTVSVLNDVLHDVSLFDE
jgi:hypothetical protein